MTLRTKDLGGDDQVAWSYDWQDTDPAHVVQLKCTNTGTTAVYGQLKHDDKGIFVDGYFQPGGASALPVPNAPAANRFDLTVDPHHGPVGVTLTAMTQNTFS